VLVALNMLGITKWSELDDFDAKTLAHIGWKIRDSLSPTVLATVAKISNAKELYDKLAARHPLTASYQRAVPGTYAEAVMAICAEYLVGSIDAIVESAHISK
jgi:hypothetical protein